jgi:predicted 3-demethylubiquinone-9 3-methyltransferase (glyoxalase superfamily)
MQISAKTLTPCLWFDKEAEEAAKFYVSVFPNSKLGRIGYYGNEGQEIHGGKPGSVLTAEFEINGQNFLAFNGSRPYQFSPAISFQVHCDTQEEIDYFWSKLTDGGTEVQCGWLTDKYGVSWQVVPTVLPKMLMDPDRTRSDRVMKAFMQMKKFDIAELERVYARPH